MTNNEGSGIRFDASLRPFILKDITWSPSSFVKGLFGFAKSNLISRKYGFDAFHPSWKKG